MLQTESRTIGSHTYHVRQLGAGEARKLLVRLTKALGPVLGALLEEAGTGPAVPQDARGLHTLATTALTRKGLARALGEFATRLTEADLDFTVRTLGAATEVEVDDGKRLLLTMERQELHFAGRMGEMFRWLGFALEVNYRDFFPGDGPSPVGPPPVGE